MRALALAACLAASAASAQDATRLIDVEKAKHLPSPVLPGVATAVLLGSRDEPGLYMTHARLKAGARVPPYTHPNTLTTVVTSGTAWVGTGTRFDEAALVPYPSGSVFVTPAGSPHFIMARTGPFSILDHGSGPSGFALADDG